MLLVPLVASVLVVYLLRRWPIWLRAQPRAPRALRFAPGVVVGLWAVGAALYVVGVVSIYGAVRGESVDPSQTRARAG